MQMNLSTRIVPLLTGVLAGVIFCGAPFMGAGYALFVYLPMLPLLLLGLHRGAQAVAIAAISAWVFALGAVALQDSLFLGFFIAIPCWYFTRHALRYQGEGERKQWYPMARLCSELCVLAAGFFMFLSITVALTGEMTLQQIVTQEWKDISTVSPMASDPKVAEYLRKLEPLAFLVFAFTGWAWLLILLGFGALATVILKSWGGPLRPNLAIAPGGLPSWLLALMAIAASVAALGTGADRFNGETVFLLLLPPYFLTGMALLHHLSRRWSLRPLWLLMAYLLLLYKGWPALFAVAAGVYLQLTEILDRRGKIR